MEFFSMSQGFLKSEFYVSPLEKNLNFTSLFDGKYESDRAIEFRQSGGSKLYDFIGTGFAGLYLISEKVYAVLKQNQINGWSTYCVKIIDKKGFEIKGYYGFSVASKCGKINPDSSKILEIKNEDGYVSKTYKGLYFDHSTWDGSDVFSPTGSMWIFVTGRVKNLLSGFSNIEFEYTEEIERIAI